MSTRSATSAMAGVGAFGDRTTTAPTATIARIGMEPTATTARIGRAGTVGIGGEGAKAPAAMPGLFSGLDPREEDRNNLRKPRLVAGAVPLSVLETTIQPPRAGGKALFVDVFRYGHKIA